MGFDPPNTKLKPPPPVKPPPDNTEEQARQRKKVVANRTNRKDFVIDPPDQGVKIL